MGLFFYKLIPPRPTFRQDMTDTEKKAMQEHFAYWQNLLQEGIVVVVGRFLILKELGEWLLFR